MRSKILENQVRSGQLSSGQFLVVSGPLASASAEVRGTLRHSRRSQLGGNMHVDCWIQQVTTRVGAVTCWIQQSVSPKQVVGFSCLFNSELTN